MTQILLLYGMSAYLSTIIWCHQNRFTDFYRFYRKMNMHTKINAQFILQLK